MIDHLPAMVAYWDRDQRNVVANAAYVEWFGVDPADMPGRHIREVLGEDVYARNLPYIEGALAGEAQVFQRTLVDTAGRVRHTQAVYVPDVAGGEVRGFAVLVTDITAQVEAERAARRAVEQYRALARNLPQSFVLLFDRDLRFSVAEGPTLTAMGVTTEQLEGQVLADAVPELAAQLEPRYRAALAGRTVTWDRWLSGGRVVSVTAVPVRDEAGEVFAGLVVGTDVTAIRLREAQDAALHRIALAAARGEAEQDLLDLIADSMIELFDATQTSVVRFGGGRLRMVSVRGPADVTGPAGDAPLVVQGTAAHRVQESGQACLVRYHEGSTGMAAAMYGAGLRIGASAPVMVNGRLWGAIGVAMGATDLDGSDILDRLAKFAEAAAASISSAAAWQALSDLATADPLTGLANRRVFEERLAEAVESAHRHSRPLSLVFIDIDHFKEVNDTLGHASGDAVLVEAARRMHSVTRAGELLARTGGDEFALVLPDTDAAEAVAAAERVREVLGQQSATGWAVSASVGVATGVGPDLNGTRLGKMADAALYESKRRGRNSVTAAAE